MFRRFLFRRTGLIGNFIDGRLIDQLGNTIGVSVNVYQERMFSINTGDTVIDGKGNNIVFGNFEFQTVNQLSYKTRE